MEPPTKRERSREYPSVGLKRAIELAEKVFHAERFRKFPASTVFEHMGFTGKNGNSAPALSAVKKFGLIEYKGLTGNEMAQLTELAKAIFLPASESEKPEAIKKALNLPVIYQEILEKYPEWDLPTDKSMIILLEREFRLQHKVIPGFLKDLRESIAFVAEQCSGLKSSDKIETSPVEDAPLTSVIVNADDPKEPDIEILDPPVSVPGSKKLMKLPMPRSETYIMLPEELDAEEAKRIQDWLSRVVTPMISLTSGGKQ